MDSSFRGGPGSGTQAAPKNFLAGLKILARLLITWLASLIELTEEEQEEAGIYHGRMWDE